MSSKSKLYTMAMMGAMLSSMAQTSEREYYEKENEPNKEPNKEPKKPIIPNGCKEYHFTRSGRFDTTENMWNDIDYIFTCVASNEKNAVKKFEKWSNENKS